MDNNSFIRPFPKVQRFLVGLSIIIGSLILLAEAILSCLMTSESKFTLTFINVNIGVGILLCGVALKTLQENTDPCARLGFLFLTLLVGISGALMGMVSSVIIWKIRYEIDNIKFLILINIGVFISALCHLILSSLQCCVVICRKQPIQVIHHTCIDSERHEACDMKDFRYTKLRATFYLILLIAATLTIIVDIVKWKRWKMQASDNFQAEEAWIGLGFKVSFLPLAFLGLISLRIDHLCLRISVLVLAWVVMILAPMVCFLATNDETDNQAAQTDLKEAISNDQANFATVGKVISLLVGTFSFCGSLSVSIISLREICCEPPKVVMVPNDIRIEMV